MLTGLLKWISAVSCTGGRRVQLPIVLKKLHGQRSPVLAKSGSFGARMKTASRWPDSVGRATGARSPIASLVAAASIRLRSIPGRWTPNPVCAVPPRAVIS